MNPPITGTKDIFESFIANGGTTPDGKRLFLTSGELRGMLDLARSEILQHRGGTAPTACANNKGTMAKLEADFDACKAAKASAKPGAPMPVIGCMSQKAQEARQAAAKPPTATATAKAAPAAPAATLTAESYLASTTRPTISRSEFMKLDHPQRNAAMKAGVRLID